MASVEHIDARVRRWVAPILSVVTLFVFLVIVAVVAGGLRIREVESALQIGRTQLQVEQIRGDIAKLQASLRIYRLSPEPEVMRSVSRQRDLLETDIDSLLSASPDGAERIRTAQKALPPIQELSATKNLLQADLFEAALADLASSIEAFGQSDSRRLGEAMARYSTVSAFAVWLRTFLATLVVIACYFVVRRLRSELAYERAVRTQTEFILESVAGSFFTVDGEWRIRFVNANAARFAGMKPSDMIGRNLWDAFAAMRESSVKEHLTSVMDSRRIDIREHRLESDGSWFELRAYPFEKGLSVSWSDTTERHLERERLVQSEELALQASRAKSVFLASMSHEIRTPLNAIVGSMSLIESEDLPESTKELIIEAEASGQMLMRIIGDILDYSRVEAGELTMAPVATDVEDVVASVAAMMHARVESKHLRFVVTGPEKEVPHVMVDAVRLRQVMINLISNAVKFTSNGSVILQWSLDTRDDQADLRISVRDTGIGIPRDRLAAIFEPFTQASLLTHAQFGGAGLGLAICREIVAAMKGTIEVASVEGSGSEFLVNLPLPLAGEIAALPAKRSPGARESLEGQAILLVDDSSVNRMIATRMLERCGCTVTSVESGLAAVSAAIEGRFDAILMDVILPDIDGIEAVRRIRAYEREHGGHRLIIALTANAMSEHEVACMEAGMDGYISKPVTMDSLRGSLCRHIGQSHG